MPEAQTVTYLFSDVEGSTRLWETDPEGAARALAWHDELSRDLVQRHGGTLVKTTGDGLHAAFEDPASALAAVLDLQLAIADPPAGILLLKLRCGLHLGADQRRDNDFYGPAVNRAARIMSAAHGGQTLVSKAVFERVRDRLPDDVALRDLGDVRLKDLGSPERVYQVIHRVLPAEFPALRSLASVPNNLPQQLDRFIGREREIEEVRQLLRDARLVTLCAMGGVGKSRLSIQLGAEVLEDFRDGVWLVELAPLSDPGDVAQAVASVLGVKEEPGGGLVPALERFVRERSMLLILDNCEHLVQGVAELTKRLLQAGARLKVLATTREPLHIAGEQLVHLPTLNVPREGESLDQLLRRAAVQLFVERAVAVQPTFRLTDKNAAPVSEICRRLDGIPLALELAAARVRSLPVEVLATRLDQRFRLLTTPDRTVLPRQRTLRALIDWSHDLLDESERAVFRRLSVFAGGWTLEAAEAVVAGDNVQKDEVLERLSSLVEKSLVAMEADSGRYRMLDTVRHYAEERLRDSGENEFMREKYVAFFTAFAETALLSLHGHDQTLWIGRLDRERENLVKAHAACTESPETAELAVRLVSALKYYWLSRGMLGTGYGIAAETVSRSRGNVRKEMFCRAVVDAGQIATFIGQYANAERHLEEGLGIARQLGDVQLHFTVLQYLGEVHFALGNRERALECSSEAEQIARKVGEPRMLTTALNARAQLLRALGRVTEAEPLYDDSLRSARLEGNQENIAAALLNLAIVAVLTNDQVKTRSILREVADIISDSGSRAAGQCLLEVCAGFAALIRDRINASLFLMAAEAEASRSGLVRDPADQVFIQFVNAQLGEQSRGDDSACVTYQEAILHADRWLQNISVLPDEGVSTSFGGRE